MLKLLLGQRLRPNMAETIARSIVHPHGAQWLQLSSFTMTSSFSPPIEIFVVFIFAVATLSTKTAKFCSMQKFPAIWYYTYGRVRAIPILIESTDSEFISGVARGALAAPPPPAPGIRLPPS